ncbi:unnamed protein product [Nesidiocoris tenuis]|uniref:Uncharacterized protein n=1 Tax=Nesidiocoris tenuis TaxID=355587 RepID=A0A6H5GTU2_9HEMI|nr:unnamed protein product [Nesidiocoris tenuis]
MSLVPNFGPRAWTYLKPLCTRALFDSNARTHSSSSSHESFRPTSAAEHRPVLGPDDVMSAWRLNAYGSLDNLFLASDVPKPAITKPREIIVKVAASSLNPIDAAMLEISPDCLYREWAYRFTLTS